MRGTMPEASMQRHNPLSLQNRGRSMAGIKRVSKDEVENQTDRLVRGMYTLEKFWGAGTLQYEAQKTRNSTALQDQKNTVFALDDVVSAVEASTKLVLNGATRTNTYPLNWTYIDSWLADEHTAADMTYVLGIPLREQMKKNPVLGINLIQFGRQLIRSSAQDPGKLQRMKIRIFELKNAMLSSKCTKCTSCGKWTYLIGDDV
jgi:hypothetical protein